MIAYDLVFYGWLIGVALAVGAAIGWATGWLVKRLLRQRRRTVATGLVDVIGGIGGFVLGAALSAMSTSFLYEEWSDGKPIARRTDGFADYWHVFAILGAVTLVVILRLGIGLLRKLICKSNINGGQPQDAKV